MKSLHGVLHGRLWKECIVHWDLHQVGLMQIPRYHDFKKIKFHQDIFQDRLQGTFHNRFQDRFHDKQTPPNNSLKLVEFETYCIKPNPPLFFRQQNMQWSRIMVHSHFTLCLRARDLHKTAFPTPMVQPLDESQGSSPLQSHGS